MKSFQYALQGLIAALRSEKNMRFHLAGAVLVTAAGIFFRMDKTEWMIIALSIAFVMIAELINTAIEKLCDVVTKEYHPQIKIIKDMSAAAVLLAAVAAAIAGLILFIPKILILIDSL